MRPYIEAYRRRIRGARVSRRQRAELARELALGCAQKLADEFGATRVYLCGSLAEGRFRLTSDIDLAVEGLAPEKFFKASAAIARFARDFDVDLIPFETYKYQAEILEKGQILYECNREQSVAPAQCCPKKRAGEVE
ncbi:nucleotidyltransferase domain-containing protein [candidate division KSB1 bacterium]|nr:nucleotidyltransferase domain-containing protein [bacterium]NUM65706.1 nucleotidyltransferase domain-containing protein [candidate division KSB1 bacterium]